MANKNINGLPTATSLNAGDKLEILQGGTNKQIDASLLGAVQSVTGPQVDDTDPNNPIVNPLGLIQIIDLNGELFTDLATAKAYIRTFIDEMNYPITNESFEKGVFYFTVPVNSYLYLSYNFMSNTAASFIDHYGLIIDFGVPSFNYNSGNNVFGKSVNSVSLYGTIFNGVGYYFQASTGINHFSSIDPQTLIGITSFGEYATGKFIIDENIGQNETTVLPEFFQGASATILVNKSKYTSNAGGINANLQTAISQGCNVQFEGIDLEKVSNKSTSIVTDQASNIKYPSVKSVYDWATGLFATIANLALKAPIASPTFTGTVTTPTIIVSGATSHSTPIFNASKEIASSIMVDLSATLTIVGWSSFTTKQITKIDCGSYDIWDIVLDGTSNSATTTVALSNNTNASSTIGYKAIVVVDNGGAVSATGVMTLTPSSNLVTFTRNLAQNNFTASGRKLVIAQFTQMK